MLRKSFLVQRDKIFDIFNREDVVKIEMKKGKNKTLHNQKVCKINVYFHVNFNTFSSFIGECIVAHNKLSDLKGNSALSGLGNCKKVGFIRESNVLKIKKFKEENNIKLYIPKELLKYQNLIL